MGPPRARSEEEEEECEVTLARSFPAKQTSDEGGGGRKGRVVKPPLLFVRPFGFLREFKLI